MSEGFSAVTAAKRKLRRRLDIKNTLRVSLSTLVWDSVVSAKQAGEGRWKGTDSALYVPYICLYVFVVLCHFSMYSPPSTPHILKAGGPLNAPVDGAQRF